MKAVAEAIIEESRARQIKPYSPKESHRALGLFSITAMLSCTWFFAPTREFYDLEGLWAEAPREKLPDDVLQELEAAKGQHDEEEW